MVTRYVNTGSTAGGDGTTNATAGANRAYATLSEAEASLSGSFADTWEIICTGSAADTTGVTFSGFTTSGTNTLTIKAAPGDVHAGIWSTSKYRLSVNAATAMRLDVGNIFVQDLQMEFSTNTSANVLRVQALNQIIDRCFIRLAVQTSAGSPCLIGTTQNANDAIIRNCVLWNRVTGANTNAFDDAATTTGSLCKFYNNTIIGTASGGNALDIRVTGQTNLPTFRNNIFNGWLAVKTGGSLHANTNYNSSDLGTTTGGANDRTSQTFTFVNAGAGDFHLDAADAGAKDRGEDLTATGFTIDIDGETRSATWDIGADETASGGTTHTAATTESGTATDAQTAIATFVSAITEAGTATAAQTATATFSSATSESVSASDSATATVTFAASSSESLTASETTTASAVFSSTSSESANLTDSQDATAAFTAATTESLSASDSVSESDGAVEYDDSVSESGSVSDSCAGEVVAAATPATRPGILRLEIDSSLQEIEGSMDGMKSEISDGMLEMEGML